MSEMTMKNHHTPRAGVSTYSPKRVTYNSKKHNPNPPVRVGAHDAFMCPSRDHTEEPKPYWAVLE